MTQRVQLGVLLLSMLLSIVRSQNHPRTQPEQLRYRTVFACEGKVLDIRCEENEVISLIRANYGRFSISVCNELGNTEWSVNCMALQSFRILFGNCDGKQNCSVEANTSTFKDQCPGTKKYLEAHYKCIPAHMTQYTTKPIPPWEATLLPNPPWDVKFTPQIGSEKATSPSPPPPPPPPPPTKTTTTTTSTTTHRSPSEAEEASTIISLLSEMVTTQPEPARSPESFGEEEDEEEEPAPDGEMCKPEEARGLVWGWTRVKDVAVQACPSGSIGVVRWSCVPGPRRSPESPDLSGCRSVWVTNLESRVSGEKVVEIANELAIVTASKPLYGGDIATTTRIIKRMANIMSTSLESFADPQQRKAYVTDLLRHVVQIASNLLDPNQIPPWKDLSHKEQMIVATSLLVGIEDNSFLLADTITSESTSPFKSNHLYLLVRIMETSNVGNEEYWTFGEADWDSGGNWLRLERKALLENSEGNFLRVVYAAFDRLEDILQPHQENNVTRVVNSKVVSASLGKGRHIQLSRPVTICLKHIQTENVTNPTCVFWDYTISAWSEEGCRVDFTNLTHTICVCSHLTNFAILMDVQATYLPPMHQMALQIITYIGCIISVICLVFSILTFQIFRSLKSDRTTIHKNLCMCLLVAELLFLGGIGRTDQPLLCGIVAGLLHFFFLCAFAWMFLEGFQLYVMLIEIFEVEKSRIRWYYLFAYGAPLVIVVVSCVIDPWSYGTDRYCWLRADNFFILSFVGPVIAVIVANLVFLSMAIYMMCRHANATVSLKSKEHSRLASARAWLRGAIVLVFLLGLTWTFGLLYLNKESIIMAYVFTALNSSQGLFIFVFHCVKNEKVQKEYGKFLRRHAWLSRCLGCQESGGTTGSGVVGTGVESRERRTSLYAGSHGNAQSTESTSASSGAATTTMPPPPHGTSNISFKSFNRDAGPVVPEQDDSQKAHTIGMTSNSMLRHKDTNRQTYLPAAYSHSQLPHLQPATLAHRSKRSNGNIRATSPWNHTYTEIREGGRERECRGFSREDDPVYEEIERERAEIQVSDMSDEDGRRQSDMSRQSSRSYGDHRPLIPYSPAGERNFHAAFDAAYRQRLKEQAQSKANSQQGTVAVLDGETVVCHLQPGYAPRTMLHHHQPYSEC